MISDRPQKHLYQKDLDDYYKALKIIDEQYRDQNTVINSLRDELSWYVQKLQEGKELVKSFGFSDQDINNLPTVKFPPQTIGGEGVENILTSIRSTFAEMNQNKNFIAESTNTIDLTKKTIQIYQIN